VNEGPDARALLLADLDHEAAMTRATLSRVPASSWDWTPHARSFSLGGLASHLAELPHWGVQILASAEYDFETATPGHKVRATLGETRERFDRHIDDLHRVLSAENAESLVAPWILRRGSRVIATMTRLDAVRRLTLHHLIHHRGQLTVYLRLLDVAVPPLYGPSADEQP